MSLAVDPEALRVGLEVPDSKGLRLLGHLKPVEHDGFSQAQIARFPRHRQISTSERYTHVGEMVALAESIWSDLD